MSRLRARGPNRSLFPFELLTFKGALLGRVQSSSRNSRPLIAIAGAVLLLVLVFVSFFVLLPACATIWSGLPWIVDRCVIGGDIRDETDDLNREAAALQSEIAALERDIAGLRCEPVAEAPEPPPEPEPEPEPKEEAAKPEECEPEQKVARASEIMFVVDTSGSMTYSIDLPKSLEERVNRAWEKKERAEASVAQGNLLDAFKVAEAGVEVQNAENAARNHPGESRMSVAKKVTIDAIDKAPGDVTLGMVSFAACDARRHGSFAPPQRGRLKGIVRQLAADNSTPLARAVQQAAASISGGDTPDDYVNMIVLSDGQDNCNGDPCQAARAAKRRKPGLVINVVDLSSSGEIQCMAELTGGFYRRKRQGMDIDDLARSVREGAGYEGRGLCRDAS